jgi:hypothetical protein
MASKDILAALKILGEAGIIQSMGARDEAVVLELTLAPEHQIDANGNHQSVVELQQLIRYGCSRGYGRYEI